MKVDIARAEQAFSDLLDALGLDSQSLSFRGTAKAASQAFVNTLLSGYKGDPESALGSGFPVASQGSVVSSHIPLIFTCPHHLLPAQGESHIAFFPHERVPGLSGIFRLVDILSRRLVLQENLTDSICEALFTLVPARAVVTVIEARHMCVAVDDFARRNAIFRTQASRGPGDLVQALEREIQGACRK